MLPVFLLLAGLGAPGVDITTIRASPRSALVAVGDRAGVVRVVDAARGETVHGFGGAGLPVQQLDWSGDAHVLVAVASAGRATTITAWDIESGTRRFEWTEQDVGELGIAIDTAGEHLLTWSDPTSLRVHSLCGGPTLAPKSSTAVRAAAWIPDADTYVVGDESGNLIVREASSPEPIASAQWKDRRITAIAISLDGRRLIVGARSAWIGAWSLPDLRPLWSRQCSIDALWLGEDSVACIAIQPDGEGAFVVTRSWFTCEAFDVETGIVNWSRDSGGGNDSTPRAAISPDGERVALWGTGTNADGLRDRRTGRLLLELGNVPVRKSPGAIGWTGDGRELVLDVVGTRALQRLDTATLRPLDEIHLEVPSRSTSDPVRARTE